MQDEVLPEPPGAAHRDAATTFPVLRTAIAHHLKELQVGPPRPPECVCALSLVERRKGYGQELPARDLQRCLLTLFRHPQPLLRLVRVVMKKTK